MLRKIKDKLNNLIVLLSRKSSSANKTFYELEKLAYRESARFIYSKMDEAVLFKNLSEFWQYSINQRPEKGISMEFGVFRGHSINYFSDIIKRRDSSASIYGFDSFEGLSEAWGGTTMDKGHFNVNGTLPKVNDNVQLIKGWIDDTLPFFIEEKNLKNERVAFIHVDVDTYSPTRTILKLTCECLQEGTVIVFDELLGYPGWKNNEFKALCEILDPFWEYKYIAFCEIHRGDYTSEYIRAAIKIIRPKVSGRAFSEGNYINELAVKEEALAKMLFAKALD